MTAAMALLASRLQVPAEHEQEFNEWYDTEHLAQLRGAPGVLSARRYVTESDQPRYLAWYELADEQVLTSSGFKQIVEKPTPWSQRMRRLAGDNRLRGTFRLTASLGSEPHPPAPWLYLVQMDCADEAREAEFVKWYETEQMPAFAQVPGMLRTRRYAAVSAKPRYLNAYELTEPGVFNSPGWVAVRSLPRAKEMQPLITNARRAMFRLIEAAGGGA